MRNRDMFLPFIILCFILLVLSGCTQNESPTDVMTESFTSTMNDKPDITSSRPIEPITVDVSFPDGAPPLGETAELRCTVNTGYIGADGMIIEVNLPEGLEFINGNLSWQGNVPEYSTLDVIKADVKSIKTGNWTIDVRGLIDPEKHNSFGGNIRYPLYLSISENSADWRINPPYGIPTGSIAVPITTTLTPSD